MLTQNNADTTLVIAADYGGQWDIAAAASRLAQRVVEGELTADAITPALLDSEIALADLPRPDLCIRTGGDHRISNFLLCSLPIPSSTLPRPCGRILAPLTWVWRLKTSVAGKRRFGLREEARRMREGLKKRIITGVILAVSVVAAVSLLPLKPSGSGAGCGRGYFRLGMVNPDGPAGDLAARIVSGDRGSGNAGAYSYIADWALTRTWSACSPLSGWRVSGGPSRCCGCAVIPPVRRSGVTR